MVKKNEITETKSGALSTDVNWDDSSDLDASDILIPKLLLMQGLSKAVAAGKARFGEIIDSVSERVLGSAIEGQLKPVMFIPIMQFKTWVHYQKEGNKWAFRGSEPATAANANTPTKDYIKDGATWRSDRTQNFFVLVVEGGKVGALPHILSFRRTSYRTGQKLYTHFFEAKEAKVPPAATTFALCGRKRENADGQPYYVLELKAEGATPPALINTAYSWLQKLKLGQHKVDDRDLSVNEEAPQDAEDAQF